MISFFLLCCSLFQAPNDFAPRLETLKFHAERLAAIAVPEPLEQEKQSRLAAIQERFLQGAADEAAFNDLYKAMDETRAWLWANAQERPQALPNSFQEDGSAWTVKAAELTLIMQKDTLAFAVNTPDHAWQFAPGREDDLEFDGTRLPLSAAGTRTAVSFDTGYGTGMTLTLADFPGLPGFELRLTFLLIGSEMVLDIAAKEGDTVFAAMNWPREVVLDTSPDTLSVIPRMQGMLIPGNWDQHIQATDLCNSRAFYMPWWGHIQNGAGVQVLLETSDDAGGSYIHLKGGPTRTWPRWYASLGKFRNQRTIRYVFSKEATYVTLAKRFRRFSQEMGNFVSLREKLARTPSLSMVIGKPVIHIGALVHFVQQASLFNKERIEANHSLQTFDQIREHLQGLKEKGVDAAYVHLDGWGYYGYDNGHPDVMPPGQLQGGWEGLRRLANACMEMNYLFAVHDQYRDFYLNAASFDDRLAAVRTDGTREEHSVWCGGPQTILSARFAPEYVRRNHDLFRSNGIPVRGAYLDVFSIVPLEESAQPTQPMTRTECARYRRECFDLLRARGYVVSSEEPTDYLVSSLDLVHHGPYATYPNIGGGAACGIPVPLFSLVYHDAILLPWEMGDDGGWGIPKGDAAWLHCFLNAGLPYLSPGADDAQVARTLEAADWAKYCAFSEMTGHTFIEGDWRRQRVEFANGASVEVDFTKHEYRLDKGEQQANNDFETRFSFDNALQRLDQIKEALGSFRVLTEKVFAKEALSLEEGESSPTKGIRGISNTEWEAQNLGFVNWTGAIEGALRTQEHRLQQLSCELEKGKGENADPATLEKLIAEYQESELALKEFQDHFQIAD